MHIQEIKTFGFTKDYMEVRLTINIPFGCVHSNNPDGSSTLTWEDKPE